MCGIVGLVETANLVDLQLVQRMRDALAHRGPDDSGTWLSPDGRVGLGHRRLSIIDLSPLAHQPMCSDDGQIVITFNGEIYNFQDIRAELQARGNNFRSASDTEVVIAAYRTWGTACLDRLVGMFALAIWDAPNRRLFVARDRAGEKPLFYLHRNGRFAFASELKAILVDPSVQRVLNLEALEDYLAYGYVSGSLCILDSFAKLPAGHWLIYEPELDRLQIGRYWDLPVRPVANGQSDPQELASELEALLMQSVRGQLIADVPIGILLSGGLDSSLVAAAAARTSARAIKTFNVAFPDYPSFDESRHARRVADYLGSEHTELIGEPSSGEFLAALIRQYDEPIADRLDASYFFGEPRDSPKMHRRSRGGWRRRTIRRLRTSSLVSEDRAASRARTASARIGVVRGKINSDGCQRTQRDLGPAQSKRSANCAHAAA